ncbi:hypothetical protein [Methylobacterium sp. SyP6R]|uniref:hypothetical protein n=1 Tax=Methylobacterium sp. SyP6R TaxID=2718876 RepID=UPI001F17B7DF|nr:hypothetical protein [Methylobacterium sp. SyP6R]MCF4125181.1 hypothetical protein [Methylobacterium sp. SyP6R]
MKPVVIFDASLFAIPNAAEQPADIELILGRINTWAERTEKQNCVDFAVLSDIIETLTSSNCFPATHNIQSLLDLYELSHVFSAHELNGRIFSILSRSDYVHEILNIEIGEICTPLLPEIDTSTSHSTILVEALHKTIASVVTSAKKDISRVVIGYPAKKSEIDVSFGYKSYIDSENNFNKIDDWIMVAEKIKIVDNPAEFLTSLDPDVMWSYAETSVEISLSINLKIASTLNINIDKIPLSAPYSFVVGTEFLSSLRRNQAYGIAPFSATVLEKCVEAVTQTKGTFVRDFNIKRIADDADGRRMHITKSHEALRLLFWVKQNNIVELANIGPKNELKIVPGDHKFAVHAIF